MAGMSAGGPFLRVTSPSTFRRGGFRFGPEPTILSPSELSPDKANAIIAEPKLSKSISLDGETWFAVDEKVQGAFAAVSGATAGMTRDDVRAAMIDGTLPIDDLVRRAMLAGGAISAAEPGKGAGADHPGASFMVSPQPAVDPNPALPASGGSTDAGVAIAAPAGVPAASADQPVAPAELAAQLATPAPAVAAVPAAETVPVLAEQPSNAEVPGDVVTEAVPVAGVAPAVVETAAPIAVETAPVAAPASEAPTTETVPVATTPAKSRPRRSH